MAAPPIITTTEVVTTIRCDGQLLGIVAPAGLSEAAGYVGLVGQTTRVCLSHTAALFAATQALLGEDPEASS